MKFLFTKFVIPRNLNLHPIERVVSVRHKKKEFYQNWFLKTVKNCFIDCAARGADGQGEPTSDGFVYLRAQEQQR